jgi:hypothetical protein
MGYLHVLERGKKWNNLAKTEQTETINRFKATVSRLRPALVVISGKENYKRLFSDTVATSRSIADGLMDAEIFWDEELNRSSKVFMIRKTSFRTDRERKVVWVQLRNLVRELRRLK